MVYDKYGQYYDLIYSSIDYDSEVEELEKLFSERKGSVKSVLDLGCGTGSYIVRFARKGYDIEGIDSSKTMLEIAKSKVEKARVKTSLNLADGVSYHPVRKYDVILCLFGVIDYFYDDSEIDGLFRNVHDSLDREGLVILDFLDLDFFRKNGTKSTVLEGAEDDLRSIRVALPELDLDKELLKLDFKCKIYRGRDLIDFFGELHTLRIFDPKHLMYLLNKNELVAEMITRKGPNSRVLAKMR